MVRGHVLGRIAVPLIQQDEFTENVNFFTVKINASLKDTVDYPMEKCLFTEFHL